MSPMRNKPVFRLLPLTLTVTVALLAAGCAVGPAYQRPSTPEPAAFKEAQGWVPAAPGDALERGPWWQLFGDAELDRLAGEAARANQEVAAAVANYAQARAVVAQQRASLFPVVSLGAGADRAGGGERSSSNQYRVSIGGSW